jgi:hypothetical protein
MSDLSQTVFVSEHEVFWGEIAPTEHVVHLYSEEATFLNMLERFAAWGLIENEGVIVIATQQHCSFLNERLTKQGFDLASARKCGQYQDLVAEECLDGFMRDGWPDEDLFAACVSDIINRARGRDRRVRAFGEMVALLWNQGHAGATVRLEHLWNDFRARSPFPLFCSYPRTGFTSDARESLREICATHTKVISNSPRLKLELAVGQ